MRFVVAFLASVLLVVSPVAAQQRPLVTEDPETIGAGLLLIEAGTDYEWGVLFPVSGLEGDLWRLPTLGLSIGISSIAEIQIDGGIFNRLSISGRRPAPLDYLLETRDEDTGDIQDLVVGAKINVVQEAPGRPAVGLRFATRLPNASNESGLGTDTFDFNAALLIGKTVRSVRVVGNAGIGILGDPVDGHRQNDVFTYGFSLARAVAQGVEIVGEVNGRLNYREEDVPVGTDTRGAFRFGARVTRGTVRIDGGVIVGLTATDPTFGITGGLTWVFRGFTVP